MGKFVRYFKLAALMMKINLVQDMQFKANFLVRCFTNLLWLVMQLVYIQVMYAQTQEVAGWNRWDMILLMGTNYTISQFFEAFFYDSCMRLIEVIRKGELDFDLVKPINTQFLVTFRASDYASAVNGLIGIAIVFFAVGHMPAAVGVKEVLLFSALVLNGIIIYYAILFSLSVWTFWIGRANNLMELYWQFGQFSRYPGEIYPWLLRGLLLTLMPMLVVSNFPAQVMLHKLQSGGVLYGFGLGVVFLAFTMWIWGRGLRRYRSASS